MGTAQVQTEKLLVVTTIQENTRTVVQMMRTTYKHVGDLGNIMADENGIGIIDRVDQELQLNGDHSIVGKAIIIHAKPDDLSSQPRVAGPRQACGVIGIASESLVKGTCRLRPLRTLSLRSSHTWRGYLSCTSGTVCAN